LTVALAGCSREDEPRRIQAPPEKTAEMPPGHGKMSMPPGHGKMSMPPGQGKMSMPPLTPEGPTLVYDTPEGWTEGQTGGMRKAAFVVQDGERKVDITAIDLLIGPESGGAGALLPNVNRWRGQIKLQETTQAELDKTARRIKVADIEGSYVELLGPEEAKPRQAILAVVAVREGKAWFFKLFGDAELALREKTRFEEFVKSVRFEKPDAEDKPNTDKPAAGKPDTAKPAPAKPPEAAGAAPLEYETPKGWTPGDAQGADKAVFEIEDGDRNVEVKAMLLPTRVEPLLPNVNRWRKQVQLDEIKQADLDKSLQPIKVGGVEGQYIELVGPESAKPRRAMLVVLAVREGQSWMFRMKGGADLVLREKERFQGFVKSVKFSTADKGKNGD
jgi:hypothetical protein